MSTTKLPANWREEGLRQALESLELSRSFEPEPEPAPDGATWSACEHPQTSQNTYSPQSTPRCRICQLHRMQNRRADPLLRVLEMSRDTMRRSNARVAAADEYRAATEAHILQRRADAA
jgi:hypothetical protein